MTRSTSSRGAWAFETARGSVRVAPDELRIHRGVATTAAGAVRALAHGRTPPVFRDLDWTAVTGLTAIATAAIEWFAGEGGTVQLGLGLLGVAVAGGSVAVSAARNRTTTVPLREIDHVAFADDGLVVHRGETAGDGDDEEREDERIRPADDAERADAAVALRLRGVELRGVADDDAVSRTVVDAPKTALLADSGPSDA